MKRFWNVGNLWSSVRHLPRYSSALFHLHFFRNVGSHLTHSKANSNPFLRSFSSKKIVKPVEKTQVVKIRYGRQTVQFRVPPGSYSFSDLLEDSKRHWNLSNVDRSSQFELRDEEGKSTFPFSASVSETFQNNTSATLKLVKVKVLARRGRKLSEIRVTSPNAAEVPISGQERLNIKQPIHDKLKERLQRFYRSPWVHNKLKESMVYLPTTAELETAFLEFENNFLENFPPQIELLINEEVADEMFDKKLIPFFYSFLSSRFQYADKEYMANITRVTDLKHPHMWYPTARKLKRKIILHIGPTNSGKTHAALNRLTTSKSGMYCGPLRLLAHEIHEKMNERGIPCNLVTGQQFIEIPHANHVSSTIEMADLNRRVEVAVIDEIQMIGEPSRGWAWTRAVLGLLADEIHLCGDPCVEKVIRKMAEKTDDIVIVNRYERLSPLIPANQSLKAPLHKLSKGDCIIAFSRKEIYKIKARIESRSNKKCCIVYGSLPPETRKQQAELFNDPDSGFDILIASDAIGMGLNLNIKRIIFSSLEKFDGKEWRYLTPLEVRQIAGRAGRFNSCYPSGEVVCLQQDDVDVMKVSLRTGIVPLETAGLFPSYEHLAMYYELNRGVKFAKLLENFADISSIDENYFLCDYQIMIDVAHMIEHINLTLKDRYTFCTSPIPGSSPTVFANLLFYAEKYSNGEEVPLSIDLRAVKGGKREMLMQYEELFQCCDLYLWLSYRFESFNEQQLAFDLKEQISTKIEQLLLEMGGLSEYVTAKSEESFSPKKRRFANETDKELLRQLSLMYSESRIRKLPN